MYQGLLFLLAVGTVALITHLIIRNKLNIEKEYIYVSANKIDKYGSIAIIVVCLIGYIWYSIIQFKAYNYSSAYLTEFILLESLILGIFRTYMQWKYNKEAKRYVLFIAGDIYGVIALLGILFVFPLT